MRRICQLARHRQEGGARGTLLHEILEVGLQEPQVGAQGNPVGGPPVGIALQPVIMAAGRIAGVENEIVGVRRIALEAGRDLGIVPVEIKDIRVDLEPVIEHVGLISRFQVDVRLRIERQLARQQALAQVESTRLVSARHRRVDRLGRIQLIGQRGMAAP